MKIWDTSMIASTSWTWYRMGFRGFKEMDFEPSHRLYTLTFFSSPSRERNVPTAVGARRG